MLRPEFRAADHISALEWLALVAILGMPLALLAAGIWLLIRVLKAA
jgi:hypothetical protein